MVTGLTKFNIFSGFPKNKVWKWK